ncbi:MAG: hypothetical protein ACREC9_00375 [Methylocella sp.]
MLLQVLELTELVAMTPIAEAGDLMNVAAEVSEESPPPGVNFWQALHVDGGRVAATMLDERAREMPCFICEARISVDDEGKNRPAVRRHQAHSPMLALARLWVARKGDHLTPGTIKTACDHREGHQLQFSGGILKLEESYDAQCEDAQRLEPQWVLGRFAHSKNDHL